ncbi:hypothetical protein D3C72_1385300 [compost metagenome]
MKSSSLEVTFQRLSVHRSGASPVTLIGSSSELRQILILPSPYYLRVILSQQILRQHDGKLLLEWSDIRDADWRTMTPSLMLFRLRGCIQSIGCENSMTSLCLRLCKTGSMILPTLQDLELQSELTITTLKICSMHGTVNFQKIWDLLLHSSLETPCTGKI